MAAINFHLESEMDGSVERIRRIAKVLRKIGDAFEELADVLAETPAPQPTESSDRADS